MAMGLDPQSPINKEIAGQARNDALEKRSIKKLMNNAG